MGPALALFEHLDTDIPVQVILENEVTYIPQLDEMLHQLSKRNCEVEIFFRHQWKNKDYGSSDEHLAKLLSGGSHSEGYENWKYLEEILEVVF